METATMEVCGLAGDRLENPWIIGMEEKLGERIGGAVNEMDSLVERERNRGRLCQKGRERRIEEGA